MFFVGFKFEDFIFDFNKPDVHPEQDEWWYILEGEFVIKVGDKMHHVKVGDSVFGLRGVPHAFSKLGEGVGRMLTTFQPAGKMEACFIAISEGSIKSNRDGPGRSISSSGLFFYYLALWGLRGKVARKLQIRSSFPSRIPWSVEQESCGHFERILGL